MKKAVVPPVPTKKAFVAPRAKTTAVLPRVPGKKTTVGPVPTKKTFDAPRVKNVIPPAPSKTTKKAFDAPRVAKKAAATVKTNLPTAPPAMIRAAAPAVVSVAPVPISKAAPAPSVVPAPSVPVKVTFYHNSVQKTVSHTLKHQRRHLE